jgi:Chaperone of endosialidase/Head domain of trimeric autotransporter adhesin
MKILFSTAMILLGCCMLRAQNNVGIGTTTPNPNAVLEIKSNTKGLLMPRLSTTARNTMGNVPKGMLVFDSSYNSFYYHDGGRWRPIADNNPDSLLADSSATPQIIATMNTSTTTIAFSGILYDNGGPSGNYNSNSNDTYIVTKDSRDDSILIVGYKVIVEEMNTESPYDSLEIYTAADYAHKEVFAASRTGTFFFQNNGSLVFKFKSNNVNNLSGFKIRWTKLTTSKAVTEPAPLYGWYFNNKKLAIRGGINILNQWSTDSLGSFSFGYGSNNKITGSGAVAFGIGNSATGTYSFAAGSTNKAQGLLSVAMGSSSFATGINAVALGEGTLASGNYSLTGGQQTQALARHSVALGENTIASDYNAFAAGSYTTASGWGSVAFGTYSTASGGASFAAGSSTIAGGHFSTAFGQTTKATGIYSFAEGDRSEARFSNAIAMGSQAIANADYSASIGVGTNASGVASVALGNTNTATGNSALATGIQTYANGIASVTFNSGTVAGGDYSFASGQTSVASGPVSTAMGYFTHAGGISSVAIGTTSTSNGQNSIVLGTSLSVDGAYSTALGTKMYIPSAYSGSLAIGDLEFSTAAVDYTTLGNSNEFVARFRGGYFFMTTANAPGGSEINRRGVKIGPGQNSWSAISDVRLKENFAAIDGEEMLHKIAAMPLTTWNYKAQDPATFRHYGPMAQDFFAAFGKDKYGTIGCDTLINQQDFLGVSFTAIQALEKRTAIYRDEINALKEQIAALKNNTDILLKKLEASEQKTPL